MENRKKKKKVTPRVDLCLSVKLERTNSRNCPLIMATGRLLCVCLCFFCVGRNESERACSPNRPVNNFAIYNVCMYLYIEDTKYTTSSANFGAALDGTLLLWLKH